MQNSETHINKLFHCKGIKQNCLFSLHIYIYVNMSIFEKKSIFLNQEVTK